MQLTGAQIIIECLKEQRTETLFGYPGGTVLSVYDALRERGDGIRHILTTHEQGAAHAADGYARATGRTGVCLVTSGPGATNTITGLATANMDGIPTPFKGVGIILVSASIMALSFMGFTGMFQ